MSYQVKDIKKIMPVLSSFKKDKFRPILENALVDKQGITLVNSELTKLVIKNRFGLDDGIYPIGYLPMGVANNDLQADDFPAFDEFRAFSEYTCKTSWLEKLIPFASKDETRLHLMCVALDDGHYVACDGHTLKAIPTFEENTGDTALMPAKELKILLRALKKYRIKFFDFKFNDQWAVVDTDFFNMRIRLVQRDYPRWKQVIPSSFAHSLKIDFWPELRDIKPLLSKRNYRIELAVNSGMVTLKIPEHDKSFAVGSCDDEKLSIRLGLNATYVARAIEKNKPFEILLNNEIAPLMINNAIVMPIRL